MGMWFFWGGGGGQGGWGDIDRPVEARAELESTGPACVDQRDHQNEACAGMAIEKLLKPTGMSQRTARQGSAELLVVV